MIPSIHLQNLLVVPRERPRWFCLPKDPSARPYKVVVEEPLVEGALPALPVQGLKDFSGMFLCVSEN
jgi:hypothetical protein